jgi:S-DNA-T family DNA segregation ATPase FtsK/SpoIIIE
VTRRYQRYPRRRYGGRYGGPAPVLLVTDDDRGAVLIALCRAAWRYRSELAPLTVTLALGLCASWAHARHPALAVPLGVATASGTAILAVRPGRWRVGRWLATHWPVAARPAERRYAAALIGLAGSWLTIATAYGPGTPPLPTVAFLGMLVGGVPWWFHHRRRARVRVERTIDAWPTFADAIGLPGSSIASAVVTRWGWTARLALRRGQTAAHATAQTGAIESALGVRPGAVRVEPDPARADRAVLRVVEHDPHAVPIAWPGIPGTRAGTGTGGADAGPDAGRSGTVLPPVELGVFEDGSPVLVQLAYRNALIGGVTGSGKSGVLNVILAALVACRDVVIWGIDLKGGMELRPWAGCLARLATTPEDAIALLADARTVRDQRTTTVLGRLWQPAPATPALIIVVDEYAELPDQAKETADSLARVGRAVMVNLLTATQRPTQAAMGGGAARAQMDVRICLRVRERRDTDLILGQGAWSAGWRADQLDAPGKFLLSDPEHTVPRPARAYLITDTDITDHARHWAARRPVLTEPAAGGNRPHATPADPRPRPADHRDPAPNVDPVLTALAAAPADGASVTELVAATGLSRATVYRRLRGHARTGRAVPIGDGRWATPTLPPPSHQT